jgi:VWFA-related protein
VSDGADTASDATLPSLQRLLLQSDVFLYAIGIDAPDARTSTRINPWPLRELSAQGGGYTEIIHDSAELVPATARIADELNHQYMLGYAPAHADGQFHSLRVFVKGEGDYQIRARRGYLARGSRSI